MDQTIDQPGGAAGRRQLNKIRAMVEVAANTAQTGPSHLQAATFRAILGHLLYRMRHGLDETDDDNRTTPKGGGGGDDCTCCLAE